MTIGEAAPTANWIRQTAFYPQGEAGLAADLESVAFVFFPRLPVIRAGRRFDSASFSVHELRSAEGIDNLVVAPVDAFAKKAVILS